MKRIAFILASAGLLFSGYLSAVKFFSNVCALNQPCPYFLGYPACYYGFAMFAAIVVFLILDNQKIIRANTTDLVVMAISFIGIVFSGYFTYRELPILFSRGLGAYLSSLPPCAVGLIFYISIFVIVSVSFYRNSHKNS